MKGDSVVWRDCEPAVGACLRVLGLGFRVLAPDYLGFWLLMDFGSWNQGVRCRNKGSRLRVEGFGARFQV